MSEIKVLTEDQLKSQKKAKISEWMKLISVTGSVQVLVQAVSFVSGIMVIRLLPTDEYALYTVANTMLGTINLLSDSGITTGVMAQGGKVWQDKSKLGQVLMTGLGLRRKFAAVSLLFGIPVLVYFLNHLNASPLAIILIIASLIPAFYAALVDSILEIVPKLHQTIIPLQKNQLKVAIGRLGLSALTLFFFPFTAVGLIAAGIPRIFGNIKLKKIAAVHADVHQHPDKEVQKEILNVVKRTLPGAVYFCISGQVTIWLISVFGQTSDVAQLGALGRITIILSVMSSLIVTLVIPRFARLAETEKLKSYFWKVQILITALSALLVLMVWIFSPYILMILGKNYSGLTEEITLSMMAGAISLIGGMSYFLYSSRGWVINPLITIVLSILALIIGIMINDINTLIGVIKLDIVTAINFYLMHTLYCIYRIYKVGKNNT